MWVLRNTVSAAWSLDETLAVLAANAEVDGLALFGSQGRSAPQPVSDYDVLVLVSDLPEPVFQMLTYIGGRMADVIFAATPMTDTLLAHDAPMLADSLEGLLMQKLLTAAIVYDAQGRLSRLQGRARDRQAAGTLWLPSGDDGRYSPWFWHNHSLAHLKRMIEADDPAYLTAVDLMLLTGLSGVCRDYFRVRGWLWQGEKAAVRELAEVAPDFLALLRTCLAEPDRRRKLARYEQLIQQMLDPVGGVWSGPITAVYLRGVPHSADHIQAALAFWAHLLNTSHPE